jgi:esterase/lipase
MTKHKHVKKPIPVPLPLRIMRWVFPKIEKISTTLAVHYLEKVFFTPLRFKTPEKELEAEASAQMFSVMCNDRKVQCYQWGNESRPYVLVVHGWAGRATQFRKFFPFFNKNGYRIIGFDGPAHGKSEGKQTSIAEFAAVIHQIAIRKGYPQAIIAHSFGGGASLYAIANGFPVKKLINIASPSVADRIIQSFLKAIGGSWKTGLVFKEFIAKKHGKPFEAFTAMELIKAVPSDFKFMIVQDEDDKDVELVHAEELLKVYPQGKLLKTSGLGHNRILRDDYVIGACMDFISENPETL